MGKNANGQLVRYRHLSGSPHEGQTYDVGDGLEDLRSESQTAFLTPTPWQKGNTYTRDGYTFDERGRLVAVGGWPVEELLDG